MKDKYYILLILLHVLLGILIFSFPFVSMIYAFLIPLVGLYYVIKNKNRNNEVLYVAAYIVGSEVFLRMTNGLFFYETGKYEVIIFVLLGFYYSGFSKNALPMWIYLLLLLPAILISTETLNLNTDIRTQIAFNISGPVCLGIASIYCYNRVVLFSHLNTILLLLALPILSTTVYLIFYTPELKTVLTGTDSNFATSGGFGPNQVATALGIGMFVFFSRIVLQSKSKLILVVNLIVLFNITYRGLVTFSRGGMLTGFVIILVLLLYVYLNSKEKGKLKLISLFSVMSIALALLWTYTSLQTEGLIDKRYANKDAAGRSKEDKLSGRSELWNTEIDVFMDNPTFGVGVGKAMEVRKDINGQNVASHSEVSRIISEHGALGILAVLILFFTPIIVYLDNKQNSYIFCFLLFWFLTINHAAMRIAAPAFVYALSLIKVRMVDDSINNSSIS